MGKASRRKVERRISVDRPRWAGAYGFDWAWAITERYRATSEALLETDNVDDATVALNVATLRQDALERQITTIDATIRRLGHEPGDRFTPETVLPGDWSEDTMFERMRLYANGIFAISSGHQKHLRMATPVLFDPSCRVEASDTEFVGLNLPFSQTFCDFMGASGQAMPVHEDEQGVWSSLVSATMTQSSDGSAIDVVPVITTMVDEAGQMVDRPRILIYGVARFGGPLGEPPPGLVLVKMPEYGVEAWVQELDYDHDVKDNQMWALLWVIAPALAAAAALRLLEAVNVNLEPVELARPARRRAEREGAEIPLQVVVRRRGHSTSSSGTSQPLDWSHRWTVRGHWMHFKRGPIFNANPRKRVVDPVHGECVKVWCPPCVRGPEDKPLVLKTRRAEKQP